MDKYELIRKLKLAQKNLESYINAMIEYKNQTEQFKQFSLGFREPQYIKPKFDLLSWFSIFASIIVFGSFLYAIIAGGDKSSFGVFLKQFPLLWSILFLLFSPFIISLLLAILVELIIQPLRISSAKKAYNNSIIEWKAFVNSNTSKRDQYLANLRILDYRVRVSERVFRQSASECGLHEKYHTSKAFIYLISYLETGRCDTLKEALNKYEDELKEERAYERERQYYRELKQEQEQLRNVLQQQIAVTEQAARNAKEAAYWGEAATAVMLLKK